MAHEEFGQRVWFFPDGDLPPTGDGSFKDHESLIILNPNDRDAEVTLTVYLEDREPASPPAQTLKARRVLVIRMDQPIGSFRTPFGQYATATGSRY
jgi:hypothetical protein